MRRLVVLVLVSFCLVAGCRDKVRVRVKLATKDAGTTSTSSTAR